MMKKLEVENLFGMYVYRIRKSHTTRQGMMPQGDCLARVWYPREIDSPGYHTPGRFLKILITRRNLNPNRKYVNSLFRGPGRFEWWQKRGSKISLDCPFKWPFHESVSTILQCCWKVPINTIWQCGWKVPISTKLPVWLKGRVGNSLIDFSQGWAPLSFPFRTFRTFLFF